MVLKLVIGGIIGAAAGGAIGYFSSRKKAAGPT